MSSSEPLQVARRTPASLLAAAFKQLRPKQWAKNAFLFAALVFSGEFLVTESVVNAVVGFIAFSLVASSGYVLNDYLDREADRRHPKKRTRPIASGALPENLAIVEMIAVLGVGVALAWWVGTAFMIVTLAYLATTLSYSFYFKHVVILDVMFLALGFVWRVVAGAFAIKVQVSAWLFLCTAFFSLFLGFNKRRGELRELGDAAGTRKNLQEYGESMLGEFQSIVTANTVLSYSLYTILGAPTPWMALTIPFVLYVVFRYIYLVEQKGEGGAPDETLLRDAPMLITAALYGITVIVILLLHRQGVLVDILPHEAMAI
ncbi:MAG: decaprenyl-phosphate phosphoribosyltransferase [Alphaproteobacteria bacterium]|nr:decaprenyl-phosphate phosphoribosyltransferase [Alphaproteobacteria bacterium]